MEATLDFMIKLFQCNWKYYIIKIKYGFYSSFSLLVQTSREFWWTEMVTLFGSTKVSEAYGDGKTSEFIWLLPISMQTDVWKYSFLQIIIIVQLHWNYFIMLISFLSDRPPTERQDYFFRLNCQESLADEYICYQIE